MNRSICKINMLSSDEAPEIINFIYETNQKLIHSESLLSSHRVFLITQGEGSMQFQNRSVPFHVGSLIFGFPQETYAVCSLSECCYLYITFSGNRLETLLKRFDIQPNRRSFDGYESLIPLWRDSLSRTSQENIDLAAQGIFYYTLSRFESAPKEEVLFQQILEQSEQNFTDSNFSINDIAALLGYNTKYLSHYFKTKMHIGYTEYLRTLRIKYAISLFDNGIISVKNAAYLSGFRDPLYFSSVFKKEIGLTPKEYILNRQA